MDFQWKSTKFAAKTHTTAVLEISASYLVLSIASKAAFKKKKSFKTTSVKQFINIRNAHQ